jgi:hypothetical protein
MPIIIRPWGNDPLSLMAATIHDEAALPQVINGLAAGTYEVGRVVWSADAITVTAPAPVLTAPDAPTISATVIANGVGVSVTAPAADGGSAITGYQVYVDGVASGQPLDPSSPDVSLNITAPGTYSITATAINAVGASPQSSAASVTIAAAPPAATAPGAPGLSATAVSGGFGWTITAPASDGGSAITGYQLYVDGVASGNVISPSSLTGTSVAAAGTRSVTARAINAVGTGPASAAASVVVPAPAVATAPAAPTIASLTAVAGGFGFQITAPTDDGGASITGYRLYSGASGSETLLRDSIGTGGTGTVLGLPETQVRIVATAINSVGESVFSTASTVTPLADSASLSLRRDGETVLITADTSVDLTIDADSDGTTDYTVPAATAQATASAPQFIEAPSLTLAERTVTINPGAVLADTSNTGLSIVWTLRRSDNSLVAPNGEVEGTYTGSSGTADATYTLAASDAADTLTLTVSADDSGGGGPTVATATLDTPATLSNVADAFDYPSGARLRDQSAWTYLAGSFDHPTSNPTDAQTASIVNDGASPGNTLLRWQPGTGGIGERHRYTGLTLNANRAVGITIKSLTPNPTRLFIWLETDATYANSIGIEVGPNLRLVRVQSGVQTDSINVAGSDPAAGDVFEIRRTANGVTLYRNGVAADPATTNRAWPVIAGSPALEFRAFSGSANVTADNFVAVNL